MIQPLFPHLPYSPVETATSFVRRLSNFHTGQGPQRLLEDKGIHLRDMNSGTSTALEVIAQISGIGPEILAAGSIGRIERCRTFRGERWSREFVTPEGARFCPECLMQDNAVAGPASQRIQIAWRLRPVSTCPIHQRRLTMMDGLAGGDDLSAPVYRHDALRVFSEDQIHQRPTVLENWVFDRLYNDVTEGGAWLDGQTIEQGTRVCEMIGSILHHGIHVNLKDMTAEALRLNAVAGFEVACEGEAQVYSALDRIRASSNSMAGQAGPKAMYGRLYEWLAYSTPVVDHGPIQELLREHILDHTAIEPGEFLLGREVTERRCHSVYSLAIAMKIHPKRLRKVLENKGLIPPECSNVALNLLVFPSAEIEAFCRDFLGSVSLAQLPLMIGGSRSHVTSLYREGVLKAVIDRDINDGIGRIDFGQKEVAGFLAKIERLEFEGMGADVIELTLATKRSGLSTGQIMTRVFSGEFKAFRTRAPVGLNAVRISAKSLRDLKANPAILDQSLHQQIGVEA